MTSDQIAFLERWENQEAAGWSIDDLDGDEVRSTVAEAVRRERLNEPERRGVEDLLLELGLMQGDVVYRATAVLFGKRRRLELDFPQCLLRVARVSRVGPVDVLGQPPVRRQRFRAVAGR